MNQNSLVMKKAHQFFTVGALLAGLVLLCAGTADGQDITYLSNLMEPGHESIDRVHSNFWLGETFVTGPSHGGYDLKSIQLNAGTVGSPAGDFLVTLRQPPPSASVIAILQGPNPSVYGTYTYTAPGVTLQPSFEYLIAVTSTTPNDSNNYYYWNRPLIVTNGVSYADDSYASVDNWAITGFTLLESGDGTNWLGNNLIISPLQFAVTARPVAVTLSGSLKPEGFTLDFQTVSNRSYTVQCTTDLMNPNWTSLMNISGNGTDESIVVPVTNSAQLFRVSTP